MARSSKYVVIYDVSSDNERNRLSKVLEGFGFRVQKSAFECVLTRFTRNSLIEEIETLALETGFVNIYRVHDKGVVKTIGKEPEKNPDEGCAFII